MDKWPEDVAADEGRRILIIEDERDSRETLSHMLRLLGYQVESAARGADGVRKALACQPEAVLVDIGLPDMDGYQVAKEIRAALGARVRLIAHTGFGHAESRRQGEEAGFDAYLVKPFQLDELLAQLTKSGASAASP